MGGYDPGTPEVGPCGLFWRSRARLARWRVFRRCLGQIGAPFKKGVGSRNLHQATVMPALSTRGRHRSSRRVRLNSIRLRYNHCRRRHDGNRPEQPALLRPRSPTRNGWHPLPVPMPSRPRRLRPAPLMLPPSRCACCLRTRTRELSPWPSSASAALSVFFCDGNRISVNRKLHRSG